MLKNVFLCRFGNSVEEWSSERREGTQHLPGDTDVHDCLAQWGSFGSLCHRVVLQTLATKAGVYHENSAEGDNYPLR